MNQYYLISQLPGLDGLDGRAPLPIHVDQFMDVCSRFLGEKSMKVQRQLTLVPNRVVQASGSQLLDSWNQEERQLRLALGNARAAKMKKAFDSGDAQLPVHAVQTAKTAVEMTDPLAAEMYLNQYRIERLNSLRPMDAFCEDSVYFYGLKLMLLERIQKFDTEKGIAAYQNIYDSILNRDNQER